MIATALMPWIHRVIFRHGVIRSQPNNWCGKGRNIDFFCDCGKRWWKP